MIPLDMHGKITLRGYISRSRIGAFVRSHSVPMFGFYGSSGIEWSVVGVGSGLIR